MFCCFGPGTEIHAMCGVMVFWNHHFTFYWKLKGGMDGDFVFAPFFHAYFPRPLRGRGGWNAATLRQAPWPCCFIILLTVVLKVLKYWTEHERWCLPSLPSLVVLFKVGDSESHASAAGLFRLTPRTITLVKGEEICVFMRDKCTLHTAPSVLSSPLPTRYIGYNQKEHPIGSVKEHFILIFPIFLYCASKYLSFGLSLSLGLKVISCFCT